MLIVGECHKKCPFIQASVCGSDGNTYVNQCNLQAKACAEKAEIHIVHKGECENAAHKDEISANLADKNENCVTCDDKIDPICGSDNRTYANECILQLMNCRNGEKIEKIRHEACNLNSLVYDKSDDSDEDEEEDDSSEIDEKEVSNFFNKTHNITTMIHE